MWGWIAELLGLKAFWAALPALLKAEFTTILGLTNVVISVIIGYFTIGLREDTFADATLNWAKDTTIGGWVLAPLIVGMALMFIMLITSLVLLFLAGVHRRA